MLNLFRFARSVPCLALFSLRRNPPRAGTRARSTLSRRRPPFSPRLAGDFSHVISILVLLLRLRVSRSALGISLKTQELFLIVFLTRYVDLFTSFYGVYNSFMKVAYIASTSCVSSLVSSRRLAIARRGGRHRRGGGPASARRARAGAHALAPLSRVVVVAPRAATSSP